MEDISKVDNEFMHELYGSNNDKKSGIPTGIEEFDVNYGGLASGEVYLIASRPCMGRSRFLFNILANVYYEHPTIFYSMDLSKKQITDHLLALESGTVSLDRILKGKITETDQQLLIEPATRIGNGELLISTEGISIERLEEAFRSEASELECIEIVIIDNLQLLLTGNGMTVNQIIKKLKEIAHKYDVVIIVTSQLPEQIDERDNHRPKLTDLAEMGINDAENVIFLYNPDFYEFSNSRHNNVIEVIVARNKWCRCSVLELPIDTFTGRIGGKDEI